MKLHMVITRQAVERIIAEKRRRLDSLREPSVWHRYTKDMECGEYKEFKQSCIDDEIEIYILSRFLESGVLPE